MNCSELFFERDFHVNSLAMLEQRWDDQNGDLRVNMIEFMDLYWAGSLMDFGYFPFLISYTCQNGELLDLPMIKMGNGKTSRIGISVMFTHQPLLFFHGWALASSLLACAHFWSLDVLGTDRICCGKYVIHPDKASGRVWNWGYTPNSSLELYNLARKTDDKP